MPKVEPFEQHRDEYERWFEDNRYVYQSEINAVKKLIPDEGVGVEIGVGSGRFAAPLGIKYGLDPSPKMAEIARQRGIEVKIGVGEELPYEDESFDFALMVTTICFLDDVRKTLKEIWRILKQNGKVIIGFVDRDSKIGKEYLKKKDRSLFYGPATFFSVDEVTNFLKDAGFGNFKYVQTVFGMLDEIKSVEPAKEGYGDGSFVVISAEKL